MCACVCAHTHVCIVFLYMWDWVDLCKHIKIDGCDSGRLVFFFIFFLDNNPVFLCVPLPRILEGYFFSPFLFFFFLYFPWCHAPNPTGDGGGGKRENKRWRGFFCRVFFFFLKEGRGILQDNKSNNQWHEMMRDQERNRAQTG